MPVDEHNGAQAAPSSENGIVVPLNATRSRGLNEMDAPPSVEDGERAVRADRRLAHQIDRAAKIGALGLLGSWMVAVPLGTSLAAIENTGTFSVALGYSAQMIALALTTSGFVYGAGRALGAGMRLEATARELTSSIANFRPSTPAGQSAAVLDQVAAVNSEIDGALKRLAEAESLIRQQVRAINAAGNAIETGAVKSTKRLEQERLALMDVTEEMSREAEEFAQKIAERTKNATSEHGRLEQKIADKEREMDSQMQRLEQVSAKSLDQFESLASAMEDRSKGVQSASAEATERHTALTAKIEENSDRIHAAQAELTEQSQRLEELITDQRKRAERLATAFAAQVKAPTPTPTAPASPASTKRRLTPWKDILSQVDQALPKPAIPSPDIEAEAEKADEAHGETEQHAPVEKMAPAPSVDHLISRLHNFSLVLHTQLFGSPSHDDLDRFENGERQVFARSLTAGDTDGLRDRITAEAATNEIFLESVQGFLSDFDRVLEPLSADPEGEAVIESYLNSPIGRLYIVTGSSVDHFS